MIAFSTKASTDLFNESETIKSIEGDNKQFIIQENIDKLPNNVFVDQVASQVNQQPIISSPEEPKTELQSPEIVQQNQPQKEEKLEDLPPVMHVKYKQFSSETNSNSCVKLPEDYATDDEDEKNVVEFLNGKGGKWIEAKKEKDYVVYQIIVKNNFNFKNSMKKIIQL